MPPEIVELAPCPRCRHPRPQIRRTPEGLYRVVCVACGHCGWMKALPATALTTWNAREEQPE